MRRSSVRSWIACCAPQADDARRDPRLEVAIERDRELRLRAVALDDARNRRETGERGVDQLIAESARARLIDQVVQPLLEGTRGRSGALHSC